MTGHVCVDFTFMIKAASRHFCPAGVMGVMEDLEDLGEQQDTNINSEADPGVRSKVRESWRGLGGAGGEIWGRGFLGCQQGERRRERGR